MLLHRHPSIQHRPMSRSTSKGTRTHSRVSRQRRMRRRLLLLHRQPLRNFQQRILTRRLRLNSRRHNHRQSSRRHNRPRHQPRHRQLPNLPRRPEGFHTRSHHIPRQISRHQILHRPRPHNHTTNHVIRRNRRTSRSERLRRSQRTKHHKIGPLILMRLRRLLTMPLTILTMLILRHLNLKNRRLRLTQTISLPSRRKSRRHPSRSHRQSSHRSPHPAKIQVRRLTMRPVRNSSSTQSHPVSQLRSRIRRPRRYIGRITPS